MTIKRALVISGLVWVLGAVTAVAAENASSRLAGMSAPREREFVAQTDGATQRYVELLPLGYATNHASTLLIFLHGHGSDRWQITMGAQWPEIQAVCDLAARHRMILISPDYRGRTSWMGPAAEADLVQLIREQRGHRNIGRVILAGGSMGGTSVLIFTALHPDLVNGVVSLNGTANLVEYAGFQDAIAASYGGNKQDRPAEYQKRSPELVPDRFKSLPIAFTAGGQDKLVPAGSVVRLSLALQKQDPAKVLMIYREAGGHSTTYADAVAALDFVVAQVMPPSVELAAAEPPMEAVAPGVWRLRLGQPEKFTPQSFRQEPARTNQLAALPACARTPVELSAIGFKTTSRGCVLELPLQAGERIYGLGMNLKVFDPLNGRRTIRVSDDQTTVLGDSHAPVPFYVSTLGYGVYVDSARYVSFYGGNLDPVRESRDDKSSAAQAVGEEPKPVTDVEELYRPRPVGQKVMTIDVPVARGVDVYLFGGPELRQAVQRYNLFSGGGCLPPLWGLGVWYRASTELGQKEVLGFLREFRERHMPCDVFGLEPGWHSAAYSCSFVWSQKYPDPDGLLGEATQRHYHLNLWEHAFTHPSSPLYKALVPWSGDYKVWNGLVPDFATPEARAIFTEHHQKLLIGRGVSGFKLDECDHQPLSATPWSFPECSRFPSGLDGEQMHLLLGSLYQQTLLAPFRQRNQRTFGLVRASGALATPLPYVLYSDAYDHRDYVRALATSGFAGILWCPEVRDMASLEEFYRRLETSVFSALTQIDCWYLKNPVWKQINKEQNNRGEFMRDWETTEAACRRLLELRIRLLPYLYSAFADYHQAGVPPVRALVMDYPDDANVRGLDDEYLFGPSLLVAPLFTGQSQRSVYLPRGEWYDFWTHERHTGGRKIDVRKPVEQIPVFVKAGTLLPLAEPVEFVEPSTEFGMVVRVFGPDPKPFVLYEDDATTFNYETGQQNRVTLSWDGTSGKVTKEGGYTGPSRYKIVRWEKE
jgi:alpha-D-xyloside xylohydrolase